MRRLARRRNILTAFFAIMGRLGKGSQSTTRPIFRVHYRKLVDEYSQQEQLKFMPALPDYMSYCCCRCGHTQKLKIRNRWSDHQQTPVTLIADQRVRLCNGCASSALPDRCISLTIFDPIFDRFHITSNKVLAIQSNDISALYINKVVQPQILWIYSYTTLLMYNASSLKSTEPKLLLLIICLPLQGDSDLNSN
ncbi:hypothetical protein G5I_08980 [Acromyrmex echinatior]|uniref:Uncharacterized protein n=1 Tax=Acromyrmex echinatior TaxID=103372 RepID=F4WT07_ACREC|nr:hypothetical protein G5I_08980 [Acromyrmex echinatior]